MKPLTRKRTAVMIIDDDEIILEITRDWLEGSGYDVSLRQSALGTTAAIMRERPDVLLVDVSMPALDGTAIASMVSGPQKHSPIVILYSGRSQSELDQLASRCGAFGGIPKTSSGSVFLAQFERLVQAARSRTSSIPA
ncbi:MAG: response regulator [Polyangia bacterium]